MPCCRRRMGASGAGRLRCAPQPPATVFLLSTNTQAIDFVPPNGGWIVSPASERLYKAMPGIPRTEDLWRKSAYDDGAIAHIVKNVPFLRSLLGSNPCPPSPTKPGHHVSKYWHEHLLHLAELGNGPTHLVSDNRGARGTKLVFKRYGPQMLSFGPSGRGFAPSRKTPVGLTRPRPGAIVLPIVPIGPSSATLL